MTEYYESGKLQPVKESLKLFREDFFASWQSWWNVVKNPAISTLPNTPRHESDDF
jgi:hypothetical protein